jgi:hypothetical protein
VAALEGAPDVVYAEPNYIRQFSVLPNDPMFRQLWGLSQGSGSDIDAPSAWNRTTGSSDVIVAVVDSGISYGHPDLAGNIWQNDDPPGGGDDDGNGFVDDTHGWDFVQEDATPLDFTDHGTHVAGTIGAHGNNGRGVVGVNWDVSLMAVRAGDSSGLADADIIQAINYACANGADVVNGSFGGEDFTQPVADAIKSAPALTPCSSSLPATTGGTSTATRATKTTRTRANTTGPSRRVAPTPSMSSASRPPARPTRRRASRTHGTQAVPSRRRA